MLLPKHSVPFEGIYASNVIVEANSFDPDQKESILCLHCLTQRLLNISAGDKIRRPCRDKCFKVIQGPMLKDNRVFFL